MGFEYWRFWYWNKCRFGFMILRDKKEIGFKELYEIAKSKLNPRKTSLLWWGNEEF